MKKLLLIIIVFASLILGCKKEKVEIIMPDWLTEMTDSLETNDYYFGSKVYRHDWRSEHYYYLNIPISSCMYCNVYRENGDLVVFDEDDLMDYQSNRTSQLIVWEWGK